MFIGSEWHYHLSRRKQWSPDSRMGIIDILNFDRKIQVNVTIISNLRLDRALLYHFYITRRK